MGGGIVWGFGMCIRNLSRKLVWDGVEGFFFGGVTLNYETTKGCGIGSLVGGGYNKLRARAIDSVGTT
jgi:hypothetical protein